MSNKLAEIDSIILCGGLGKRLESIAGSKPKAMLEINQKPFLDILIEFLIKSGCKRTILCIGHLGETIKSYYGQRQLSIEIIFSEEKEPLGTGGAIKNAKELIKSDTFLAMNGDSFCNVGLDKFFDFHIEKNALLSLVLAKSDSVSDYAKVELEDSGRITSFQEKPDISGVALINAGIYLMKREIFSHMPENNSFSLEKDVFPQVLNLECHGFLSSSPCIDIGTPQRYENAKKVLTKR